MAAIIGGNSPLLLLITKQGALDDWGSKILGYLFYFLTYKFLLILFVKFAVPVFHGPSVQVESRLGLQ